MTTTFVFSKCHKKVWLKSDQKQKKKILKKYSTQPSWHLESSFENLAQKLWQKSENLIDPINKILAKLNSYKKTFHTSKFLSRNAKCSFGNPARSLPLKVRRNFIQTPKMQKRLVLPEKIYHQKVPQGFYNAALTVTHKFWA